MNIFLKTKHRCHKNKKTVQKILKIMKFSFIFLIFAGLQVYATAYSQTRISMNAEGKTIREALKQIEKETDYRFFYSDDLVFLDQRTDLNVTNSSIDEVLRKLFKSSDLGYRIFENSTIIVSLKEQLRQGIPISGIITDTEGLPLPGVNVVIKGTNQGTITNADGAFSIAVPNEEATLVFSSMGYVPQEILVGSQRAINVTLSDATREIEEVVVVGYGTQKVSTLTGSVAQIKSDKLTVAPIGNVTNVLAGQLPGLITKQTSGIPGYDGAALTIRSFDKGPLVIVDGMENSFDKLDINQIETISILKDGSASIYGARAGNGVILITTKRGAQSKPKITVNSSFTLQGSTKVLKPATSAERAQYERDKYLNVDTNNPSLAPYTEEEIQKYRDGNDPKYPNTDWFGAVIRKFAPQQNHNLTISGGTEAIKYYGYFGYNTQEFIIKKNGGQYDRFNFQVNLDAKITRQISAFMDIKHFKEKRYFPCTLTYNSNFWNEMIYSANPMYPMAFPDPSKQPYADITVGNPLFGTNTDMIGYWDRRLNNTVFTGELRYDFKYIHGLNAKGRVIYLTDDHNQKNLVNQESFYTYIAELDQYTFMRNSRDPKSMQMQFDNLTRLVQQYSLNYSNVFHHAHTVSGMLLYEWQEDKNKGFSAGRSGFITMSLPELSAGDALSASNGSSSSNMGRVSWMGRLNYSYMDRYMIEAMMRADASSRYADGYRWSYFPSVSLGWNIAKENFMSNLNSLDLLKVRLSYGSSGYDGVANFAFLNGYIFSGSYTLGDDLMEGLHPTSLANFILSWEKMSIYNAGIDFSLWNHQLYGEFDYFYRERSGIPATRRGSIPNSFGSGLPLENLNSQSTSGFEFRLGTSGKAGDLHYDILGNINYAVSKWIDFDEADYTDPDEIRLYKNSGKVIDRRIGYITDGLFTSQQEIDQWSITFADLNNDNSSLRPGDVKYKDLNGDKVIDWRDTKEIGKGVMPHATFGLNINLKYKNFDLAALLQGAFDYNTIVDFNGVPISHFLNNYWHETRNNKADALVPRPAGSSTNRLYSDYHNLRTAYMRLKYLSIGYEIPVSLLTKIGVEKCRFYVAGTNLFTFSSLDKYNVDPEMPEGYGVAIYYPQQFTMSIGCSFTF